MNETVLIILLATSILFNLILLARDRSQEKALERELSLLRDREKKKLEKERQRLEDEYAQNIKNRQLEIDNLIESYEASKMNEISLKMALKRAEYEETLIKIKLENEESLNEETSRILELQGQVAELESVVEQLKSTEFAVIESRRRDAMEVEEFHLNMTDTDLYEIGELQTIAARYGRIRPILLKAIYDIYYAPEVKNLVSRILGDRRISGIYRITSRRDGRVYVGKSVDVRKRWITHFKRASGVETETQNLLYPAMREQGVQNFDFELIEEVEEEKLSEREKFWQEFYKAKDFGLSVR